MKKKELEQDQQRIPAAIRRKGYKNIRDNGRSKKRCFLVYRNVL